MKQQELLNLAALLHDIGKFRMRHTQPTKRHQEHSYEFVNDEFADFFAPCGELFKDAIRHHHPERYPKCPPTQLKHRIEKLVILADRLSASERDDEEREREYFGKSPLVSIMSRLKGSKKETRYLLRPLDLERDTTIPKESADVDQAAYTELWKAFTSEFQKLTRKGSYVPATYRTIGALLHKYTSRMPSATPWGQSEKRAVPDISLYNHLRTAAAIAACIWDEELSDSEIDSLLRRNETALERNIATLIKGDISGIQDFLYHIVSDGAARQLRGRSFYLQLLTEAIAHWVLRQLGLPITNLLLASGGHFYILAPYTQSINRLDELRQTISEKLWALHAGDLSCILADVPLKPRDFEVQNFSDRWSAVSKQINRRKQQKWSEFDAHQMFKQFFEPHKNNETEWNFETLGGDLREATTLVAFEVPESSIPEKPNWLSTMQTFGWDIHLLPDEAQKPKKPEHAESATVYRLGDTDFLKDEILYTFQWDGLPVNYDFQFLPRVIAHRNTDDEKIADYDDLANASEGVEWLGALRMDVDNLATVFIEKLGDNATISRLATLSESLRFFFEAYLPRLCREYNAKQKHEILELIYAGGDDLFLVGGWSALPQIAKQIRDEFREFVTGDHVTLSGGIAIQHKKYPLYQFALQSGEAQNAAKRLHDKNAIVFLQKPIAWTDFENVSHWHQRFLEAFHAQKGPLPHAALAQFSRIYADEKRWAWRSLYYFQRLKEQYSTQKPFLQELQRELNLETSFQLRQFIDIITRWTALRIRE